ncbi:MAG: glycosyltransferase family A protein [Candidatus Tritonobacter lacicola]|nr:glycosyltransferase family A protein [Candidatus Tritonobacter lacicola]
MIGESAPDISVIIPTHNRRHLLEKTLKNLEKQEIGCPFEVLVVDDGSTDGTRDVVNRLAGKVSYPLIYLHQDKGGPASARNMGIGHAGGRLITFTDDDCMPEPKWLGEISEAFRDPAVWAVSGPVWSEIPPGVFVHSLLSYSITVSAVDHFMTSNFSVRRDVAIKIGLFDTRFRDPWFEDYDFAYRIRARGGTIAIVPGARVHHPVQYQPFLRYLRKTRFSRYSGLMQLKYPGRGFGREIRGNLKHAGKIMLILILAAILPVPWTTPGTRLAILWVAAAFLAARRLQPLLRQLGEYKFSVRKRDQAAYILFSWMEGPLRGLYTLLGLWLFTLDEGKRLLTRSGRESMIRLIRGLS